MERVGVAAGEIDVGPARLDRLGNVTSLAELVPGLDGENLSARAQGGLELARVVGAVPSVDVETVGRGTAVAETGVVEARANLGCVHHA